jgi:hypothetical protein
MVAQPNRVLSGDETLAYCHINAADKALSEVKSKVVNEFIAIEWIVSISSSFILVFIGVGVGCKNNQS